MSEQPTRPLLAVYVVWHPDSSDGKAIADLVYNHFRRAIFSNVSGGAGLSVLFRFERSGSSSVPVSIDYDSAETTAIVAVMDDHLTGQGEWPEYLREIGRDCDKHGFRARLFPVALTRNALHASEVEHQAIRAYEWEPEERDLRLRIELAHQFSRQLRYFLEVLRSPDVDAGQLESYLAPVRVFLSHSKHDRFGQDLATKARDYLHNATDFGSFFDARNIPPGLHFDQVLMHFVRVSAVVAFHTDSYSSREWCRREILEAKRHGVPLVVANALDNGDERGFPYMGNVPIVQLDNISSPTRIPLVVGYLLDEVLKDFLWKCRVAVASSHGVTGVRFLARWPELISVAALIESGVDIEKTKIVYPDPPIGPEEAGLFSAFSPLLTMQSYTEWLGDLS